VNLFRPRPFPPRQLRRVAGHVFHHQGLAGGCHPADFPHAERNALELVVEPRPIRLGIPLGRPALAPECPELDSGPLVASAGRPQGDPKSDWSRLDDEFQRIPLGVGKIAGGSHRPGPGGERRGRDPSQCLGEMGEAEEIHGFDAQPIRYKDEVLGVLGLFTRIPFPSRARPGCAFLPITSPWLS